MSTDREDVGAQSGSGPLAGVRVLDLTHVAAGPFATMLLADMGAEVIKVERPGVGDGARQMDVSFHGGESGYYLGLNKNKRSVAVDITTEDGVALIHSLAKSADVFIENFRPGAADRRGIGYQAISKIRPDIVYCSISGFGAVGPLRDDVAYDIIGQAMSGIMSITGDSDRPPAKCGAPIADLTSGTFAALGVVAALHHRARTGQGQHVETSLLGSTAALVSSYVTSQALGTEFDRLGSAHNTLAPYQAFAGADGKFFILAVGNDHFWQRTAQAIGLDNLVADPRFITNPERSKRRAELADILQKIFDTEPASHWLEILAAAGVPVSPIYGISEMMKQPQMRENGYIVDVVHPTIGALPMTVAPITFSATPVSVRRPPPTLDQDHDAIVKISLQNSDAPWA